MTIRSYRQASKTDWGNEESEGVTLAQINTGAILRIADATEKMAQRHTDLMHDRDYWERRAKYAERSLDTERRRSASLRGHLKRAKKQMSNAKTVGPDAALCGRSHTSDGLCPGGTERNEQ